MRSLYVLWLFLAIGAPACSKRNPAVCCETPGECAAVGFGDTQPCEEGACVYNTCVPIGCDGPEDCNDSAKPLCVANECQAPDPDPPAPPAPDWVTRHGGPGEDSQPSIAVLSNGDLIITANFTGTISVGGDALVAPGTIGSWVARYATDGTLRWSSVLGDATQLRSQAVAIDANDDIYIIGNFHGSVNLGGGVRNATSGSFIVKLRGADGGYQWDTILNIGLQKIVVTSDAVVVLTLFTGTIDLGQGPRTSLPIDGQDGILAGFRASSGESLWSNALTTTGQSDYIGGVVAVDGDVIVTGGFTGTAMLGGDPLAGTEDLHLYMARYHGSDGAHVWSRRWGSAGDIFVGPVAIDGTHVYVGGHVYGTANFGGTDTGVVTSEAAYMAAYNASDGSYLWDEEITGAQSTPKVTSIAANTTSLTASISLSSDTVAVGDRSFTAINSATIIAGFSPSSGHPTPTSTLFAGANPTTPEHKVTTGLSLVYSGDVLAGAGTFNDTALLFDRQLYPVGGTDIAVFRVQF